jgi:hypothetical protein
VADKLREDARELAREEIVKAARAAGVLVPLVRLTEEGRRPRTRELAAEAVRLLALHHEARDWLRDA